MKPVLPLLLLMNLITASKALSFCTRTRSSVFFSRQVARRQVAARTRTRRSFHPRRSTITMMPEGPEVRTLVDQLQGGVGMRLVDIKFLSGRYVRHGKPDGFTTFAKTMTPLSSSSNETTDMIQEWNCKGKFIYIRLDNGTHHNNDNSTDFQRSIWITLGMSGRFLNERSHNNTSVEHRRHARWYLSLLDPTSHEMRKIFYHDARNFGTLKFCLSAEVLTKKLDSLGPDILNVNTTTEEEFVSLIQRQKPDLNICKFLMNQSKLCGIGNYILSEALYRAGVDPFASLQEIDETQQRRLLRELQATALESYKAQGLTRSRGGAYRDVEGNRGQFEFALQCYGRESCARGKPVIRETQGPHGRTIWYTEDQLFMPRILRYGSVTVQDESVGQLDDVETPVASAGAGAKRNRNDDESSVVESHETSSNDYKARLIAGLHDTGWKEVLSDTIASSTFGALAEFLANEERQGATVYPPQDEIFSALNMCPFDKVKVVIVGQDPYHGPGQGHGLAFSVRKGVRFPPSLKNIFNEAMDDIHIEPPEHGYLKHWAEQGVLLLNTILTVRQGEANSHAGHGWEEFTDSVIDKLNTEKENLVFLLWGNPAAKKASGVDDQRHTVIKTSHPSPLGATKTDSPFLGSRCFSRANEGLESYGKTPIDWNVQ